MKTIERGEERARGERERRAREERREEKRREASESESESDIDRYALLFFSREKK